MPTDYELICILLKQLAVTRKKLAYTGRPSFIPISWGEALKDWAGLAAKRLKSLKPDTIRTTCMRDEAVFCIENDVDFTRKVIAGLMALHPKLISKFADRSLPEDKEDMPYYHHAQMVTNQFLDYFLDCEIDGDVAPPELMIWMLVFHDMDKQISLTTHGKIGEHDETVATMREYTAISGFPKHQYEIACRMVSTDCFGDYFFAIEDIRLHFQTRLKEDKERDHILDMARRRTLDLVFHLGRLAGVKDKQMVQFFIRYLQFYQCDFSSYSLDSRFSDVCFAEDPPGNNARGPNSFTGGGFFEPAKGPFEKNRNIPVKPAPVVVVRSKPSLSVSVSDVPEAPPAPDLPDSPSNVPKAPPPPPLNVPIAQPIALDDCGIAVAASLLQLAGGRMVFCRKHYEDATLALLAMFGKLSPPSIQATQVWQREQEREEYFRHLFEEQRSLGKARMALNDDLDFHDAPLLVRYQMRHDSDPTLGKKNSRYSLQELAWRIGAAVREMYFWKVPKTSHGTSAFGTPNLLLLSGGPSSQPGQLLMLTGPVVRSQQRLMLTGPVVRSQQRLMLTGPSVSSGQQLMLTVPASRAEQQLRKLDLSKPSGLASFSELVLAYKDREQDDSDDEVLRQFRNGGLYIRKLLLPKSGESPRKNVTDELAKMENNIARQPDTPYVMPSTLVLDGFPGNLTDAGTELLHSSGFLYHQDTPIAPSHKEHSESVSLGKASVLGNAAVRNNIQRIFGKEYWRGIVRAELDPKGGKSYETREALVLKLREMELRRAGKMPDLSTKELLCQILSDYNQQVVSRHTFHAALNRYQRFLKEEGSRTYQPLPDFIVAQLKHKIESIIPEGETRQLKDLQAQLNKPRKDRYGILGGGKRGLKPGNRYFRKDKFFTERGSSEANGYDGYTFQTNEVLLLPECYANIIGIYCNTYSLESRIHALNLAWELYIQTGITPGFYEYSARAGMRRTDSMAIFRDVIRMTMELAQMEGHELQGGGTDKPKDHDSGGDKGGAGAAKKNIADFFQRKFAAPFMPAYKPAKDRGTQPNQTGSSSGKTTWQPMSFAFMSSSKSSPLSEKEREVLRQQAESARRRGQAAGAFDVYINLMFMLTNNPGGGDCLYYSVVDGMRHAKGDNTRLTKEEYLGFAQEIRRAAAAQTAALIRRGVGLSPVMFGTMKLKNRKQILNHLDAAGVALDALRREALVQIRQKHHIEGRIPDNPVYHAEADALVMAAVERNLALKQQLARLAAAYEEGQSEQGQYASDLDIRGIALALRINIRMHYVAPGHLNSHRVDSYNYHELAALYFDVQAQASGITIDVFHTGDNHYQFGRPKG